MKAAEKILHILLSTIREDDEAKRYAERNKSIYHLLACAAVLGYPCGIRFDESAGPEWPVIYVTLPEVGQISFHVPCYPTEWDFHTTEEKYERIERYLRTP